MFNDYVFYFNFSLNKLKNIWYIESFWENWDRKYLNIMNIVIKVKCLMKIIY